MFQVYLKLNCLLFFYSSFDSFGCFVFNQRRLWPTMRCDCELTESTDKLQNTNEVRQKPPFVFAGIVARSVAIMFGRNKRKCLVFWQSITLQKRWRRHGDWVRYKQIFLCRWLTIYHTWDFVTNEKWAQ